MWPEFELIHTKKFPLGSVVSKGAPSQQSLEPHVPVLFCWLVSPLTKREFCVAGMRKNRLRTLTDFQCGLMKVAEVGRQEKN